MRDSDRVVLVSVKDVGFAAPSDGGLASADACHRCLRVFRHYESPSVSIIAFGIWKPVLVVRPRCVIVASYCLGGDVRCMVIVC